jgi:hypothetical protein
MQAPETSSIRTVTYAPSGSDEDVALSDADDKIVVCQSQRNVS